MSVDNSEKDLANFLGGQLTLASGAIGDSADIHYKNYIIECKRRDTSTSNENIVLYTKYWKKLVKQSIKHNKIPVYVYQTDNTDYIFIEKDIAYSLYKEWIINKTNYNKQINYILKVKTFNYIYDKLSERKNKKEEIGIVMDNWIILTKYCFKRITQ